jgi:predicted metal-binding membrane protein
MDAARRDRILIGAGLTAVAAAGWSYLYWDAQANHCARMAEMAGPHMAGWGWTEFTLMFAMWSVMMVAMMAPSVAPMVMMFAEVSRKRREQKRPYTPAAIFFGGYVAAWTAFSLLATITQWGLQTVALLSAAMAATSVVLASLLLIAAGVFQWTPWKTACLTHCRTPLHFIMTEWREGAGGALTMGWRHGLFCIGCCWALMLLLFVAGVMNLAWVAAISVLVLLEKLIPRALWFVRASGAALALAGGWMLLARG